MVSSLIKWIQCIYSHSLRNSPLPPSKLHSHIPWSLPADAILWPLFCWRLSPRSNSTPCRNNVIVLQNPHITADEGNKSWMNLEWNSWGKFIFLSTLSQFAQQTSAQKNSYSYKASLLKCLKWWSSQIFFLQHVIQNEEWTISSLWVTFFSNSISRHFASCFIFLSIVYP